MSHSNIIDISNKLKEKQTHSEIIHSEAPILDMKERREEMIQQERRQVKRTILTEFLGAFMVVPQKGLQKITLYDVSENGLSFDTEEENGHLDLGDQVAMRVYLNKYTYFPFVVTVSNMRFVEEEGVYRHGVSFVKGTINDVALHHFVKFIENISASLRRDGGDILVSNLGR